MWILYSNICSATFLEKIKHTYIHTYYVCKGVPVVLACPLPWSDGSRMTCAAWRSRYFSSFSSDNSDTWTSSCPPLQSPASWASPPPPVHSGGRGTCPQDGWCESQSTWQSLREGLKNTNQVDQGHIFRYPSHPPWLLDHLMWFSPTTHQNTTIDHHNRILDHYLFMDTP